MSILDQIVQTKRSEIDKLRSTSTLVEWKARAQDIEPARDFVGALRGSPPIRLIAEVKKASPSQGVIRDNFDPVQIARDYQAAGASCVSVLTDEHYFQGHLDYLRDVKSEIDLPVLRKDFILDPIQVWQARAYGADAVLLIAECLTADELQLLFDTIQDAGMAALVELYQEENIEQVLAIEPPLVGVNNRDLNTFKVDLNHSLKIKRAFSENQVFVSESGIRTPTDVKFLEEHGVDAILVGQSLCEQDNIVAATQSLISRLP